MYKKALIAFLFVVTHGAFAQVVNGVGTVNIFRGHDSTLWGADSNFITVNGFSSAGSCRTSDGLVE